MAELTLSNAVVLVAPRPPESFLEQGMKKLVLAIVFSVQ
jgi:hypothetical protein